MKKAVLAVTRKLGLVLILGLFCLIHTNVYATSAEDMQGASPTLPSWGEKEHANPHGVWLCAQSSRMT